MNKSTVIPAEYIDTLPLSPERKGALRDALPVNPEETFSQLHHQLAESAATQTRADDAPQQSVKARIEMSWPESIDKGDRFDQMR